MIMKEESLFSELIRRIWRNYKGFGIENKKYIEITISNIIGNQANNYLILSKNECILLVSHVKYRYRVDIIYSLVCIQMYENDYYYIKANHNLLVNFNDFFQIYFNSK